MERPEEFKPRISDDAFYEYLRVCQELYLEMVANGTWLWDEPSPFDDNLV